MTTRATLRGADRTPIEDREADVLVCGASFAGLAVARELAGSGADVLVVDRYEIGERQTSACAAPTPWLHAMGVEGSIRQEIPHMSFHTPHGTARYRLPWSWSAFDYRTLCELLWAQCDARFEIAKVEARTPGGVSDGPRRPELRRSSSTRWAGGGCWALPGTSRRSRRCRAGWRCTPTAAAPTSTCGSTARLCGAGTAGACPPAASSGWAPGPTSPATTSRSRPSSSPGAWACRRCATRATGFPTASAPRPRTASSSRATRPATASRSPARASGPRSTSASPAGASCAPCWRASARARRRCAATRPSAPATPARSGWRYGCSG